MSVSEANRNGLKRALDEWLASAEGILSGNDHKAVDRWKAAVSSWIVDATLLGDTQNLREALESLRNVHFRLGDNELSKAVVSTLMEVLRPALDRARQKELEETLDSDSRAARVLIFIDENSGVFGPSDANIAERLHLESKDVASTLSALRERGLVLNTRHIEARKSVLRWSITPRGKAVVENVFRRKAEAGR